MSLRPDTLCLHKLARMRYLSLPTAPHCQVTYVWINQDGTNPKAKTRILDSEPQSLHDVPQWYSTYYLDCVYEMTLIPVQMFRDPFLLDPHKLVLCDTRQLNGAPALVCCLGAAGNRRPECAEAMEAVKDQKPWFGFEQEYLLKALDGLPFGWASTFQDNNSMTSASAHVGLNKVLGRDVSISHCNACLYAGVKITGITGEVIPAQWEFQVGPCEGLALGDHAWMARYILHRVCEDFGVVPSFHPKPVEHPRWASGGHMNFSTENMRAEGGITHIHAAIKRLAERHTEHIEVYGNENNRRRLSGVGVHSHFSEFTFRTADRKCSVRIPGHVNHAGQGYLEDRRPPADCDPYLVCKALVQTCILPPSDHTLKEKMSQCNI
ncbi:hypothetical protein NQD34_001596 [Periophthalmus magnuspinnatus]|nr:hypothetical protein NQD34_001596 [Periophthalmus magnuspinnatus]